MPRYKKLANILWTGVAFCRAYSKYGIQIKWMVLRSFVGRLSPLCRFWCCCGRGCGRWYAGGGSRSRIQIYCSCCGGCFARFGWRGSNGGGGICIRIWCGCSRRCGCCGRGRRCGGGRRNGHFETTSSWGHMFEHFDIDTPGFYVVFRKAGCVFISIDIVTWFSFINVFATESVHHFFGTSLCKSEWKHHK